MLVAETMDFPGDRVRLRAPHRRECSLVLLPVLSLEDFWNTLVGPVEASGSALAGAECVVADYYYAEAVGHGLCSIDAD